MKEYIKTVKDDKIAIFVIAYNAESHIENTLSRIPEKVWDLVEEVFIVDDCSIDETVQCSIKLESDYPKLHVIRNTMNKRYGGNQKYGFQYAINKGYDIIVLLHADGQYAPEYLPQIIEPLISSDADIVLGSRMIDKTHALRGGMPKYKFIGNIILTKIQNILSSMNLHEFHTGYRAYRTSFLKNVPFFNNTDEWHFDTEILLQACAVKAKIVEIPIPTYYGDEICHVNGISYALNCIFTSLRYAMQNNGIFYSRNFDVSIPGHKYSSKFNDPYSSHTLIYNYLQQYGVSQKTILELGVGDSTLTQKLCEDGAIVDCIELDKASAHTAQKYARHVWNESLEIMNIDVIKERYDIIVAADILEHLVHPEAILSRLKKCIKKDGLLLVSLPNVANIYVRLNILFGRFPYHTKGILDSTHLHFYTVKTAERLVRKTGWVILDRDFSSIPVAVVFPFLQRKGFRALLYALRNLTIFFKGLFSYQCILYCKNPNESHLL